MAFATSTFQTSRGVMNRALEQRAAKDTEGEESLAANFSLLRMACSRVISNDDTFITRRSQYIF